LLYLFELQLKAVKLRLEEGFPPELITRLATPVFSRLLDENQLQ